MREEQAHVAHELPGPGELAPGVVFEVVELESDSGTIVRLTAGLKGRYDVRPVDFPKGGIAPSLGHGGHLGVTQFQHHALHFSFHILDRSHASGNENDRNVVRRHSRLQRQPAAGSVSHRGQRNL